MQEMTTVQMVQWLSSVSANQCQMCALVRIPPGANFFPPFFSLPVMLGRQSTYTNDIPWVMLLTLDLDLGMITYTSPKSLSNTQISDVTCISIMTL